MMMKMKKLMLIPMFALVLIGLVACGNLSDEDSVWNRRRDETETTTTENGGAMAFTPGVYEATSEVRGYYGPISVRIVVGDNGDITDIEVTAFEDTPNFAENAFDYLIPSVIANQTYQIDGFGGATESSNAFLDAVRLALMNAGGVASGANDSQAGAFTPGVFEATSEVRGYYGPISVRIVIGDNGEMTEVEVTAFEDTPNFAENAFDYLIPGVLAAQSANIDGFGGATESSNAFLDAVRLALISAGAGDANDGQGSNNSGQGTFTPGVFEATSNVRGYYGPISVRVTIGDSGDITDIEVTAFEDTPNFAENAFDYLIPAVIGAQTADIDGFSGATESSNAFLDAVHLALNDAQ